MNHKKIAKVLTTTAVVIALGARGVGIPMTFALPGALVALFAVTYGFIGLVLGLQWVIRLIGGAP